MNGRLYRHRFSAVSLCPRANERMVAVTFSWAVTLALKKEVTGDKEGMANGRGKTWGICIRQVAIQVETRIKKNNFQIKSKINLKICLPHC